MSSGNIVEHTGPASAEAKIHARDSGPWFVSAQVISFDGIGKLTYRSRQDIGTGGLRVVHFWHACPGSSLASSWNLTTNDLVNEAAV